MPVYPPEFSVRQDVARCYQRLFVLSLNMKERLLWLLLLFTTPLMAQNIDRIERVKFLALGDSYTIGESVAEDQRWPVQLIRAFAQKGYATEPPTIIATTGWRTDDLKRAILAMKPPRDYTLVSLLIGVNNQ